MEERQTRTETGRMVEDESDGLIGIQPKSDKRVRVNYDKAGKRIKFKRTPGKEYEGGGIEEMDMGPSFRRFAKRKFVDFEGGFKDGTSKIVKSLLDTVNLNRRVQGMLVQNDGLIDAGTYMEREIPQNPMETDDNFEDYAKQVTDATTDTEQDMGKNRRQMFVRTLNNLINSTVNRSTVTGVMSTGAGVTAVVYNKKISNAIELYNGLYTIFERYVEPLINIPSELKTNPGAVSAIRMKYYELILNEFKMDLENITAGTYNTKAKALHMLGRYLAGEKIDASIILTPDGVKRLNNLGHTIKAIYNSKKGAAAMKTELFKPIADKYKEIVKYAQYLNALEQVTNLDLKKATRHIGGLVKQSLPNATPDEHAEFIMNIMDNLDKALTYDKYADFVEFIRFQNETPLREIGDEILNIDVDDPRPGFMQSKKTIEYQDYNQMIKNVLPGLKLLSRSFLPSLVQSSREILSTQNMTQNLGLALAKGVGTAMNVYKQMPDEQKYYLNETLNDAISSNITVTPNVLPMLGN